MSGDGHDQVICGDDFHQVINLQGIMIIFDLNLMEDHCNTRGVRLKRISVYCHQ